MNKGLKNSRGMILLLTLLILSSILVVTLGAADLVMAGIKMNRLTGYSSIAFFASEAGMERALWEARKNSYSLPGTDTANVFNLANLGNGSAYQVDFYTSSPFITFKSIGSFKGARRSVESTYDISSGACLPDCTGKVCGDDGCAGSCGSCNVDQWCVAGACVDNPANVYVITASAGSGGFISPSGEISVNEGDDQTFNMTADSGYRVSSVLVDSVEQGGISSYPFTNVISDHTISASFAPVVQILFEASTSWVVPAGVTSVSAVCVGGGGAGNQGGTNGGGGGGGGLRYINNLPVTPGETITITIGSGGVSTGNNTQTSGGSSGLLRGANVLVQANGGTRASQVWVTGGAGGSGTALGAGPFGGTIGGATGGTGGNGSSSYGGGGGGAGGYSANGGNGGATTNNGNNGAGGSAGGGGGGETYAGGGGGVGLLGEGSSGSGGIYNTGTATGGSGGTNGASAGSANNIGGPYGGGGGGVDAGFTGGNANGAAGACRIIWPGNLRSFPSTRTADE
jgi:hypothetical protein